MRAGPLDRQIQIKRYVETGRDPDYNAPITVENLVATVWASIKQTAADEAYAGNVQYDEKTVTFTIRWRTDIQETDYIVHDNEYFDIQGIREIGRREGLEIKARWSK